METLTVCPVCDAPASVLAWAGDGLMYYRCLTCGVYYLNPRMNDAETERYYRGQYRKVCPVSAGDLQNQARRAKIQWQLCGKDFGGSTMLELGCSAGKLLSAFAAHGYACVGVDPDTESSQDDNKVYPSLATLRPQPFDMICLSHVLEHFNHPRQVLDTLVKDYAHPGSRIMIEVPNMPQNKANWRPHHPIGFTAASLDWLMGAVGCKLVARHIHGLATNNPFFLLAVYEVA